MRCPYCGYQDSRVIDSRSVNDGVRRRRQCLHCNSRFTTYERAQGGSFLVVKKDGRREEFDRGKLITGIRKACAKRSISNDAIVGLADGVEGEIHQLGKVEVPSSVIGELIMERLKDLDRIAYIRFASVYREFADVESFAKEVEALAGKEPLHPGDQLPLIPGGKPRGATRRKRRETYERYQAEKK
jgi:transcriptional repressor NrdR